jgi:hypothetical protein
MGIVIDVEKAKAIGHDMRRAARAEEFKPFDEAIAKQIPGQQMEQRQSVKLSVRSTQLYRHRSTQQQHPTRSKQH